jgi:hypothetical protein
MEGHRNFSVFEASRTDPSVSAEQGAAADIMSGESCRRTRDRATGGRMRGGELGRNGEVGRSRRCGEVESGLEMGWPELGRWRLAAAAAVVRVEWIQSERGGARLGFTFPSGLSVSVQSSRYRPGTKIDTN